MCTFSCFDIFVVSSMSDKIGLINLYIKTNAVLLPPLHYYYFWFSLSLTVGGHSAEESVLFKHSCLID